MIENRSEFGLPINLWLTRQDAIVGLLVSSLFINLLGLVFPICVLQFYDRVIPNKSWGTLLAMVCIVFVGLVAETLLKVMRAYVSSWSSARFTYNMGTRLFHHLVYSDLGEFRQHTAGEYLDKFNSAESIREYYCGQNLTLLVDVPFVLVYLGLMFVISPILATVPTLVIIFMYATGSLSIEKTRKKIETKTQMSEIKSKFLIEMISGIHTVKALGMEEQFLRRYERLHQREILSNYELIQNTSESTRNGSLYSNTAVILTGFVGGVLVIYHYITVGGLAASILVAGRLMLPVTKFITYLEKKKELGTAMNDLNFIMSFKNEYAPGLEKLDQFHGEITLTNASFKFPNSEKYAFQDINLKIKENETLILHGPLGSGKSTLLLLISSLYKPTEGSVLIDGINIQKLDLDDYRSKTAYISESGDLFTGTIMENLTLFEVDKYASQARELAKILGLHEIIEAMPQSYDTMVGTGTVDLLSKGHKQIVLLIRALVDNPKVILFDEANIALDVDSDVRLRKYLLSQKGKCTMVLVTHRPSLIAMGDRHIKLENGKISEITWQ